MQSHIIAALVLILIFVPVTVSAAELLGESRTYLQSRETADHTNLLPIFEYLDVALDKIGGQRISFHLGGWARQDLNDKKSFDSRNNSGDLQYAYVGLYRETGNTSFDLGRVPVTDGVASEQVDGLSASTDLKGGFGLSAYGGVPVETDFDDRSGDAIYGGRISHEIHGRYRLGLSFLKERNDRTDFRREAGADLLITPVQKLVIHGWSHYNVKTSGWMEHAYTLTLGPFSRLRFNAEITSTNYEDYFQAVDTKTTSVFSFQPGIIDPREKLLVARVQAQYAISEHLSLILDYTDYDYRIDKNAVTYGGDLLYSASVTSGAGLSLSRMQGQNDQRRYYESRVYAYREFGRTSLSLDLLNVTYDKRVSDMKNATSASLAVGYRLADRIRVSADLDYSRNPSFDYDLRALIKLRYGFDTYGRYQL